MSARKFAYQIVDVFTDRIFGGNPLAVFTDGRGLSDAEMQSIAKEMNLSETTFVLPAHDSANHFNVRVFTPARELPMAGHPTIGTAFVLARDGYFPTAENEITVKFEEKVGVIPVRVELRAGIPGMIWMTQPQPTFGPAFADVDAVARILSIDREGIDSALPIEVVSCGVPYLMVPVRDLATMHSIRFRAEIAERELGALGVTEVFAFAQEVEHSGSNVHSRMFAPELGVPEDPATGSAAGPLGCYLVKHGVIRADPSVLIINEQGVEMGRPSFLHIRITQTEGKIRDVQVGGRAVFVGAGKITLPE